MFFFSDFLYGLGNIGFDFVRGVCGGFVVYFFYDSIKPLFPIIVRNYLQGYLLVFFDPDLLKGKKSAVRRVGETKPTIRHKVFIHYLNADFEFISVFGGLHSVPPTLREKPGMDWGGAIKK